MDLPRVNILGVPVSAINMNQTLDAIRSWKNSNQAQYIICRDAHGLVLCQKDKELRSIHNNAGLVTPDGMPLVWLLRKAGYGDVSRVYGPDLLLAVVQNPGYRHYFYGGAPGIPEQLTKKLKSISPHIEIAGTYSPPFRSLRREEDEDINKMIIEAKPDIVWVGLSTPKQERWMASHVDRLNGAILIGIGAAFDFHAESVQQAPYFIQRSGFEWLFRLCADPKRLWKRYFTVIPLFMLHVLLQMSGIKKYPLCSHNNETS